MTRAPTDLSFAAKSVLRGGYRPLLVKTTIGNSPVVEGPISAATLSALCSTSGGVVPLGCADGVQVIFSYDTVATDPGMFIMLGLLSSYEPFFNSNGEIAGYIERPVSGAAPFAITDDGATNAGAGINVPSSMISTAGLVGANPQFAYSLGALSGEQTGCTIFSPASSALQIAVITFSPAQGATHMRIRLDDESTPSYEMTAWYRLVRGNALRQ